MRTYLFNVSLPDGEIVVAAYGNIMPQAMKKVINHYNVDKSKVRCYRSCIKAPINIIE